MNSSEGGSSREKLHSLAHYHNPDQVNRNENKIEKLTMWNRREPQSGSAGIFMVMASSGPGVNKAGEFVLKSKLRLEVCHDISNDRNQYGSTAVITGINHTRVMERD